MVGIASPRVGRVPRQGGPSHTSWVADGYVSKGESREPRGEPSVCAVERRCCVEMAAGEMAAETVVGMTVAEVKVAEMPVRDIVRE